MVGVVSVEEAIKKAYESNLDLIEVSPNAEPPVCKILDSGKYKYELQKRKAEARKRQKTIDVKEIKIRPNTDTNDYNIKLRNMKRFIEEGNKVKVTVRFKGREIVHQQLGMDLLNRIKADMEEVSKIEFMPKLEGKQMIMILAPNK